MLFLRDHDSAVSLDEAAAACSPHLSVLSSKISTATVRFTHVQFAEVEEADANLDGALLLCPNYRSRSEIAQLLREAGRRGAAAIVLRAPLETDSLAPSGEVAVLELERQADWADIAGLLRALVDPAVRDFKSSAGTGDLFAAANALASRAGGAVAFIDPLGRVVGYSTHSDQPLDETRRRTTLSLQEDLPLSKDADHSVAMRSLNAVALPPSGEDFGRVVRAVRQGSEILGTIWVIVTDDSRAREVAELLDATEPVVAQHFRRARDEADRSDSRRREAVEDLLNPSVAPLAAARRSLPAETQHVVLSVGISNRDKSESGAALRRLLDLSLSSASTWFAHSASALIEDHIITVVSASTRERIDAHADFIARADESIVIGIGSIVAAPGDISTSAHEADMAMTYLLANHEGLSRSRIATFADVRDLIALRRVGTLIPSVGAGLSGDALDRLEAFDAAHGSELVPTVYAYLQCSGNVAATARALHVHDNTVRYRLTRVREEVNVALEEPATRLWLWLRLANSIGA